MSVDKYLGLTVHPATNGKRQREVAIIGVGHTPWLLVHKDPEWKGGVVDGRATDSRYNVYPIPTAELSANPNLKNDNY